jgi:HPt (histidine-containing phosphotransfer) domain-containing protein
MVRFLLALRFALSLGLAMLSALPLQAETSKPCFSCRIEVNQLDEALNLEGAWLFTREDRPENARPETSTQDWVLAEAPGPWNKIYGDKQNFNIGWYRGNFHFSEAMLGQTVVFYVDAYMSKMDVYLDGQPIFERSGQETHKKYFSIQPVPITFQVTKPDHVIALRINTRLMTGIYQSPFQLRPFKAYDPYINFFQIFCGELRYLFAYIFLWTGAFFLILFARTRYPLYLVSGLTGIGIYPFYAMPNDIAMKYFDPDTLLVLHYPGIGFMALGYFLFSQFFKSVNRKASIAYISIIMLYALSFLYMTFDFHMGFFQVARKSLFIVSFAIATHGVINCMYGFKNDKRVAIAIVGQIFFWMCSGHDILLALGLIKSTSLIFVGTFCGIFSIMLITTQLFAETFIDNKRLLKKVELINEGLEKTVRERTLNLLEKTQEIASILDSLPEGILEADRDLKTLGNYSQAITGILGTEDIAGRDLFELVFASCNLTSDTLAQARSVLDMSLGESRFTFEANKGGLPTEILVDIQGKKKVLAIGWSVICDQNDNADKVLVTLNDITRQKSLEQESVQLRLRARIIEAVIDGSQSRLISLIRQAHRNMSSFWSTAHWSQLDPSSVYRELHTLKGNSRTFELTELSNLCHLAETELAQFKKDPNKQNFVSVDTSVTEVLKSLTGLMGFIESVSKGIDGVRQSQGLALHPQIVQDMKTRLESIKDGGPIADMLQALTYINAGRITEGLKETFRPIAKSLGKDEAQFHEVLSPGLLVDAAFAQSVQDMLGHLVRNSLDHGIEKPEDRQRQGKSAQGQITIELALEGDALRMRYRDDGSGLDLNLIRDKGAQLDLCSATETATAKILECIFHSGFTTARQLTMISGRGVGMDVIQNEIKRWQGQLRWVNHPSLLNEMSRVPFDLEILFPARLAYQLAAHLSQVA